MKNIFLILLVAFFFSGCSFLQTSVNTDYKELTTEKKLKNIEATKLNIPSKHLEKRCISLTTPKRLTTVLNELYKIDGRLYYKKLSSTDIEMPVLNKAVCVNSLRKLNDVLMTTTIYRLEIVENMFKKNMPKVIEVKYKNVDFSKKKFTLKNANQDMADSLADISSQIGYTIVYKQADINSVGSVTSGTNAETNKVNKFFENKYININSSIVEDLLDNISISFNLYYDIYPDKKLIVFSKYKLNRLKLTMLNTVIATDITTSSNLNGENGNNEDSQVVSQVELKLYDSVKGAIDKIIGTTNSESEYSRILPDGTVIVKTTKDKMYHVEKTIYEYNKSFSQDIILNIDIYNVLVSNEYTGGIDLNYITDAITVKTSFLDNSIATLTKTSTDTKQVIIDSLNNFGKFLNVSNLYMPIKNYIPKGRAKSKNQEYFKSTKLVQTGGTDADGNPLYERVQTIENAITGIQGKARASITGDSINVDLSFALSNLVSLDSQTQNNETVTVKTDETDNFDYKGTFYDGETRIVDAYYFTKEASDYEGIVPIQDFIIGGSSGKTYVKKALVFVVSVKKARR